MADNLKKDFFDMAMHDFSMYMLNLNSKCDIPKDDKIKDKYYQVFKNIENRRFAKLISWLYLNYSYKTFPAIADFQKAFTQTSEGPKYAPPEKVQSGKYAPLNIVGTVGRLLKEIHRWYDQGIYWDFNGVLKPLTYPRTDVDQCIVFQGIAEESEKYFSDFTRLNEFYKNSMLKLRTLRLKRRREGNFKEREKRFGNL